MRRRVTWYRLAVLALVAAPAALCQLFYPVIPLPVWEQWSEDIYGSLLGAEEPMPLPSSDVVVVEIDQETERRYGWPLERKYLTEALLKLKERGQPWILSLLELQELGGERDDAKQSAELERAIESYDRYVGTALTVDLDGEGLDWQQAEELLPRAVIAETEIDPEELPDFPIALTEAERFVRAERAFGMGQRFGTEPVIYCVPLYVHTEDADARYALPTSMLWAAAYQQQASFRTTFGATWLNPAATSQMLIAAKHCLSSPGTATTDVFRTRHVGVVPFHALLEDKGPATLEGKLVVLSSAAMRSFQGPGRRHGEAGSGVTLEHHLVARFLDDLLTGRSVRREALDDSSAMAGLPIALAALFFACSFFVAVSYLAALTSVGLAGVLFVSYHLASVEHVYWIPVSLIAFLALIIGALTFLSLYMVYYGMQRASAFGDRMQRQLMGATDLEQLQARVKEVLDESFLDAHIALRSYSSAMYEAVRSPEKVAAYLSAEPAAREDDHAEPTRGVSIIQKRARRRSWFRRTCGYVLELTIAGEQRYLGEISLKVVYPNWQDRSIERLLANFEKELTEQWDRLELQVEQKIRGYQVLLNETRSQILEKFLPHSLVSRFIDSRTMEENLKEVLTPRHTRAAILQADIRGYSRLFDEEDPITIVRMLQGFYKRIVDAAQLVAQVKLIGDCIFLFIEDKADGEASAVDLALQLAAILAHETERQNALREPGSRAVVFGIAIHYGEVIVGNLSSDTCIDYTVVGPNVNMTARMEELTKKDEVRGLTGANGVLISSAAVEALRWFKGLEPGRLDLQAVGLTLRSFPDVKEVCYYSASELEACLSASQLSLGRGVAAI